MSHVRLWLCWGCTDSKGPVLCFFFLTTISSLTGIRRWNYFAIQQLLVYDIINYRWCENVQRFHKSNNIMYVFFTSWLFPFFFMAWFFLKNMCFWSGFAIFGRIIVALKEEVWYQKCHDPECRNFKSSSKLWAMYDGFIKPFPGVWTILGFSGRLPAAAGDLP